MFNKYFSKMFLGFILVVSMVFNCNPVYADADYYDEYNFERNYNLVAEYNKYQTKDIDSIMESISTGSMSKIDIIYSLLGQCNSVSFYYADDITYMECYHNDEYVYIVKYRSSDDMVSIEFSDAKYNGKHISKQTVNDIIGHEKSKCIKKKRNYTIDKEFEENEMSKVYRKTITINESRSLSCFNSSDDYHNVTMVSIIF